MPLGEPLSATFKGSREPLTFSVSDGRRARLARLGLGLADAARRPARAAHSQLGNALLPLPPPSRPRWGAWVSFACGSPPKACWPGVRRTRSQRSTSVRSRISLCMAAVTAPGHRSSAVPPPLDTTHSTCRRRPGTRRRHLCSIGRLYNGVVPARCRGQAAVTWPDSGCASGGAPHFSLLATTGGGWPVGHRRGMTAPQLRMSVLRSEPVRI